MSDNKYFKGFTIIDEPLYDHNSEVSLKYPRLKKRIDHYKETIAQREIKDNKLEKIWNINKWEKIDE